MTVKGTTSGSPLNGVTVRIFCPSGTMHIVSAGDLDHQSAIATTSKAALASHTLRNSLSTPHS
jgi:hypothetical protein